MVDMTNDDVAEKLQRAGAKSYVMAAVVNTFEGYKVFLAKSLDDKSNPKFEVKVETKVPEDQVKARLDSLGAQGFVPMMIPGVNDGTYTIVGTHGEAHADHYEIIESRTNLGELFNAMKSVDQQKAIISSISQVRDFHWIVGVKNPARNERMSYSELLFGKDIKTVPETAKK
jgi:hypothetical protein